MSARRASGPKSEPGRRAGGGAPAVGTTLIFGESDNDRQVLKSLVLALAPQAAVQVRRSPLVLIRGREAAEQRKAAAGIAQVVRADQARTSVRCVVAHEDCDAVEPAHEALAEQIEQRLGAACEVPVVAAVPAWETETWFYLWPDAVAAYRPTWRRLARTGRVGLLQDAKEQLVQDLRPPRTRPSDNDYAESDGPGIAEKVRLQAAPGGTCPGARPAAGVQSESFDRFRARLAAVMAGA